MPITNFLSNKALDHLSGGTSLTANSTLHFALFTSAPSLAGGGTEVSGGSYARVAITNNSSLWASAVDGVKKNASLVSFDAATASWGTVTHVGIYDATTSGNLLWFGALQSSAAVASGDTVQFAIDAISITLAGEISHYAASELLDFVFGAASWSKPSNIYFGAMTSAPLASGGGTEVSGGSYARANVVNNVTNFPAASTGSKSNGVKFSFAKATASWGTITAIAAYDAPFGGNLLYFSPLDSTRTVDANNTLQIPIGDLDLAITA